MSASRIALLHLWCQTAAGCDVPFFHNALDRQTDRPTDRPTDRSFTGKFDDIGRCAPRATRPKNTKTTDQGAFTHKKRII